MIQVTRLNGTEQYWINDEHIEFIEETPDTIISLMSGKKMTVVESAAEVIRMIDERRISLLYKSKLIG